MSLKILNFYYYLLLTACWAIGFFATSLITSIVAGIAFCAVWLARETVEQACTYH